MELEKVETAEDGTRYYYWSDGAAYPSVTTITGSDPEKKERIANWREDHPNPDQYRDRQGTLGSIVHYRILNDIAVRQIEAPKLDLSHVDDDLMVDADISEGMFEDVDLDPGDTPYVEKPVRNDEHEYAGRFDLLTEDGILCDLKVSPAVWDSYRMQAAAYARAINEYFPEYPRVREAKIITLHPNPDNNLGLRPKVVTLGSDQLDYFFNEFIGLRERYRQFNS